VYVHTDIFSAANHERALLSVGGCGMHPNPTPEGRPFILRQIIAYLAPSTSLRRLGRLSSTGVFLHQIFAVLFHEGGMD